MAVYVIQFDQSAGTNGRNAADTYVGYAEDERVAKRIREHLNGTSGAAFPTHMTQRLGAGIARCRVFLGLDRGDERRIKKGGHFAARYLDREITRLPAWLRSRLQEAGGYATANWTDPLWLRYENEFRGDGLPF